jgi:hypothetical protein
MARADTSLHAHVWRMSDRRVRRQAFATHLSLENSSTPERWKAVCHCLSHAHHVHASTEQLTSHVGLQNQCVGHTDAT